MMMIGGYNMSAANFSGKMQQLVSVDIELDRELFATFCRRGRRRLREIQASSEATLKLDRSRGILCACGTESAIAEVRRQLECLGGPRKHVTAALWAELMRTRTVQDASLAAIECIQQHSECRVHIERSKHEVRLFGPNFAVSVADRLLDELGKMCTEKIVMANIANLAAETLHQIAHTCSVTLRVEGQEIFVLGLSANVHKAGEEMQRYVTSPGSFELRTTLQSSQDAAAAALSKLQGDGNARTFSAALSDPRTTTSGSLCDLTTQGEDDSDHSTETAAVGKELRQSRKQSLEQTPAAPSCGHHCPTCGAANYCVRCGHPTGAAGSGMVTSMSLAAFASMPRHQVQMEGAMPMWGCNPMPQGEQQTPQMPQHFIQQGMVPVCFPGFPAGMYPNMAGMMKDSSAGSDGLDPSLVGAGHSGQIAFYSNLSEQFVVNSEHHIIEGL